MTDTEGVIVYNVRDYQKAIEFGGDAYRKRYGKPPVYVALPSCVDPSKLQLWTLRVASHKASGGTVQLLGRNGNVAEPFEKCPNCGAEPVSKPAWTCWNCGCDVRERTG